MSSMVREKERDFLTFYNNPVLRNAVRKFASKIRNIEDREDAEQDAWADILALNPIDNIEAKQIARAAIRRAERRINTIEINEIDIDQSTL